MNKVTWSTNQNDNIIKAYKKYKGNWKLIIKNAKIKMSESECKKRIK